MGTRHLTCVVVDGEMKVAQYGQWDGYLEGQGKTIVEFLTKLTESEMRVFKDNVRKCTWVDDKEIDKRLKSVGSKDGWMTLDQSEKWKQNWPELSRDTGAEILMLILIEPRGIQDARNFAADSLFCEFAYVVDLDKEVLEIYRGFQTKAHKSGRFAKLPKGKNPDGTPSEYYPVKLVKKIKIRDLPEAFAEFEEEFAKAEEVED